MDVAVSDKIRFLNVYRKNDSGESFLFEGYDFWLRGFSTMKICTGRKGEGGGQNPWKLACRISRWRSFRSSYGEFLSGEWYLINCSIIFQILKDVSVFFFFSEKVDFSIRAIFYRKNEDPGNLVTESSDRVVQRSWRVHLVYLCGFDRLNDDTSSLVR